MVEKLWYRKCGNVSEALVNESPGKQLCHLRFTFEVDGG
uniref:Uncharacterized protein n=1 Tax=Rhizophora mucronata TaxID=61149 RepID=A0A2P2QBN3_RHIMU